MISAGFFVLVAKFVTNEDLEQKAPEGKFRRPPEPLLFVFVVYLRLVVSVLFLLTNRLGEFQLLGVVLLLDGVFRLDRKSTRLNSSH